MEKGLISNFISLSGHSDENKRKFNRQKIYQRKIPDLHVQYCVMGIFWLVQIFAYFEHIQIVWKLEHANFFARDYKITWFFLARQLFVYYGAPDAPVNMVAVYHHLDGERNMNHELKILN